MRIVYFWEKVLVVTSCVACGIGFPRALLADWAKQLEEGDKWEPGQPMALSADELAKLSQCHDELEAALDAQREQDGYDLREARAGFLATMRAKDGQYQQLKAKLDALQAGLLALEQEIRSMATVSAMAKNIPLAEIFKRWANRLAAL